MSKLYPIGIQNFESLRNDGYLYVDKTRLIYQLVKTGRYKLVFLAAPAALGRVCLYLLLKHTIRERKNYSKDWLLSNWKKTGSNIRYYTLI